jgi:hypothetical protein
VEGSGPDIFLRQWVRIYTVFYLGQLKILCWNVNSSSSGRQRFNSRSEDRPFGPTFSWRFLVHPYRYTGINLNVVKYVLYKFRLQITNTNLAT